MDTDNINKIIGERIKSVRNKLELTGEEFGKKLNVQKPTISRWEKGHRLPDADMINKIATLGNVSADFILGRTDDPDFSLLETNYKGKDIKLVINSKTNNYSQEQIQALVDKLSQMYVDVDKLINSDK